jgi:Family of unknown function (DUF6152)
MRRRLAAGAVSLLLLVCASPGWTHHSFASYEATEVRSLLGTVKSFQWNNPHVTVSLLVMPDAGGEPQEWQLITSGPSILQKFDWTRDSLKPGDRVGVVCNPLTDGSRGGRLHTLVVLKTGRVLKTKLSLATDPIPE